jgi:aminopeptidase-like protein
LCGTKKLRDSLNDDKYNVVIRTEFEPGEMKIGEILLQGKQPDTFVIEAHLCHPAQANDDLSGVVVAVETARRLLEIPRTNYTYRILIVPETIGTVAFLSHNEDLIPDMAAGLFLEMLGNDSPHALQGSFQPDSQADRCMFSALRDLDKDSYNAPYRSVINNDERQFNAPGVRVPMLSLSRVEAPGSETRPYREYHSSLDDPTILSSDRLEDSARVVFGLIQAWERNQYVVNQFKGEIFCSGYGIWIDYKQNPEGHQRLFEIMERCDGERTIADIACELDISFKSVAEVVDLFYKNGLVKFNPHPQRTNPQ